MISPDMPLKGALEGDLFLPHAPNQSFAYSNAGYVLLAEIAQQLAGESFPDLASAQLKQCGVLGGFNWAGVADFGNTLPTFRNAAGQFVPKIDEAPQAPNRGTLTHAARFSPQGGLRTSLSGMLAIAHSLKADEVTPIWSPQMGIFDAIGGVFESYGWGVQIFDAPVFYPRPLLGHFGNAYGFNGGVWYDRQTETAFAYALNGVAEDDESDTFSQAELAIFDAIATI